MMFLRPPALCCAALLIGACEVPFLTRDTDEPPAAAARPGDDAPRPQARAAPDAAEPAGEAAPEPAADGTLGETVASLGSPSEPGLWLRTPLVDSARPGRVVDAERGADAQVELRPSGGARGAGSRLSVEGFRALGRPLTELPRLRVLVE